MPCSTTLNHILKYLYSVISRGTLCHLLWSHFYTDDTIISRGALSLNHILAQLLYNNKTWRLVSCPLLVFLHNHYAVISLGTL